MLPLVGFGAGAAAFALLALLVGISPRPGWLHRWLIAAALISSLWLAVSALAVSKLLSLPIALLTAIEVLRSLAWIGILGFSTRSAGRVAARASGLDRVVRLYLGSAVVVALAIFAALGVQTLLPAVRVASGMVFALLLGLAVIGLGCVELLFRNTHPDDRWAVKYLCLGLGVVFACDVYLYAEAALFSGINSDVWLARGAVNALAVPLLLVAVRRNPDWALRVFVSRQVVYHGATFFAVGGYLLLLAGAGYYLKTAGGTWGGALRVVLVAAGIVILLVLLFSGRVRAEMRQFLARHFYQNKYDYAEQWLRFAERLAAPGDDLTQVGESILRAVSEPVESTGGILYLVGRRGGLEALAHSNFDAAALGRIEPGPALRAALDAEQVVSLREPPPAVPLPENLAANTRAWALVPMAHNGHLRAVILLAVPRAALRMDPEDAALLATLGKQAAALLALVEANQHLAESRQFDAFSRLAAFVVHDIKNVVAQLDLIQRNAVRHRDNPEFVEDAFNTVGSAVERMNRLLAGLRKTTANVGDDAAFLAADCVEAACRRVAGRQPVPALGVIDRSLWLEGDRDRLGHALEHLLTNAQEATPDSGEVRISVQSVPAPEGRADEERFLCITIADTGAGMSAEFISQRLFAPFDTTKGNAGMGIGVFEARHVVEGWGGAIEVESAPGAGTRFEIYLPVVAGTRAAEDDPSRSAA